MNEKERDRESALIRIILVRWLFMAAIGAAAVIIAAKCGMI